jgi:hypothetical protein
LLGLPRRNLFIVQEPNFLVLFPWENDIFLSTLNNCSSKPKQQFCLLINRFTYILLKTFSVIFPLHLYHIFLSHGTAADSLHREWLGGYFPVLRPLRHPPPPPHQHASSWLTLAVESAERSLLSLVGEKQSSGGKVTKGSCSGFSFSCFTISISCSTRMRRCCSANRSSLESR